MIDANLRTLKIHDELGYTMKTGMCSRCGHNDLCHSQSDEVQTCAAYMPVLAFQSLAGCELSFNTVRLGSAWSKRVTPGKTVALVNKAGEKLAEAVVEAVRVGPRTQMIAEHAAANHLMVARKAQKPNAELTRVLRNLYGPNFLARAETMSVIYLRIIE